MKVLLWECGNHFYNIVLYDGQHTYWIEEMRPSRNYENLKFNKICKVTKGRFTLIGEL